MIRNCIQQSDKFLTCLTKTLTLFFFLVFARKCEEKCSLLIVLARSRLQPFISINFDFSNLCKIIILAFSLFYSFYWRKLRFVTGFKKSIIIIYGSKIYNYMIILYKKRYQSYYRIIFAFLLKKNGCLIRPIFTSTFWETKGII